MREFLSRFLDVSSTDPDDRRRARLLNILLLGMIVLTILSFLAVVAAGVTGVESMDRLVAVGAGCLVMLLGLVGIYLVNRYLRGWLASALFLLLITLIFAAVDQPQEVANGRSLVMFAIPVMMASVILPPYASFFTAGLCSLMIAVVALGAQLVPNPFAMFVFFALALVSWLAARGLERALAELRVLNVELQDRAERLREMDRLKSQFMANMSHELRTPLNAIMGFTQVILMGLDGPLTEAQKTDLTAVHENSQRLLALVTDVMDITKIQAGEDLEFDFVAVDLRSLIEGVMSSAVDLVEDKAIELRQEVQPDLPPVWGDEIRLRQVIRNLVSNATKFTDAGSITVRAWEDDEKVTVSVMDTGIGIAPEHQAILFEEFRQVDGSLARRAEGAGLGLPISHYLVEKHGGRIWVESVPGEGSTFSFSVPVAPPGQ